MIYPELLKQPTWETPGKSPDMVGNGRETEKVMLQGTEGAVEVGTRLMAEKRGEEALKESSRLLYMKAQPSSQSCLYLHP